MLEKMKQRKNTKELVEENIIQAKDEVIMAKEELIRYLKYDNARLRKENERLLEAGPKRSK